MIIEIALANTDLVQEWFRGMEARAPEPYEVDRDPDLMWKWSTLAYEFVSKHPRKMEPKSESDFCSVIDMIVRQYKEFVEDEGGWPLLWDRGTPGHESKAQRLFRGIAKHYCAANDISLDPEVNLGAGPVDFKFSRGHQFRALMEVKKLHAGRFWHGLDTQLAKYMKSDKVRDGWYMALQFGATKRSSKVELDRLAKLDARVRAAAVSHGFTLRHVVVDARRKPSASRA